MEGSGEVVTMDWARAKDWAKNETVDFLNIPINEFLAANNPSEFRFYTPAFQSRA